MMYGKIIEILLTKIPSLSRKYDEEKDLIENLPHLVFGMIFVPYFMEIMEEDNKQTQETALELLEEMIVCDDKNVKEVAVVSVLEPLLSERNFLMNTRNYFGTKTKEVLFNLEKHYGWIE